MFYWLAFGRLATCSLYQIYSWERVVEGGSSKFDFHSSKRIFISLKKVLDQGLSKKNTY